MNISLLNSGIIKRVETEASIPARIKAIVDGKLSFHVINVTKVTIINILNIASNWLVIDNNRS
jgi:hypothetical protein